MAGARPNFMKVAPVLDAARSHSDIDAKLVHTGQHYDERMSALFFEELGLPRPDAHLGVGSGTHAVQTARIMEAFDGFLDRSPADIVLVVGDVNSTIACGLVAVKRGIRVAHVEAGLRSRDWTMPEEVNRILTDQISDYLFTTERSAEDNLRAEGIAAERVHFVGNVMIDTLLRHREKARGREILHDLRLTPRGYAACTLHRPGNVDTPEAAENTVRALEALAARLPVVLPIHPRTESRFADFGLLDQLRAWRNVILVEPLGYLDFLALMDNARLVFTDSGGIQEETTVLGVPCLTFRENTERPITITQGTNQLVGLDPTRVAAAADEILSGHSPAGRIPDLWDGRAAERIVAILA
ncbi:MAG: UDP-N-acetylglucosamine 2-epimerase (non-hydrolyzing) [Acidobacteria bacterium]|nr:UDP-N-acetylglucosamine 2-epimerase (non-hydrolyzing) [Acidobacteriota bacterium]